VSKKLEEIKEDVSTLSEAIRRLDSSTQGLARSFGQFGASGNTTWNIISRLSSGTGFWRLQNRVRAVSNVFQEYFDRQTKAMEATLDNLDANLALEKSLNKLNEERDNLKKTELYKMFEKDALSSKQAEKEAESYYETIIKKIEKVTEKRKKAFQKSLLPGIRDRLREGGVIGEFKNDMKRMKEFFGPKRAKVMDKIFGERYVGGRFMPGGKRAKKGGQRVGFIDTQTKNIGKVFEFARIGIVLFGKLLLYGSAIVLVVSLLLLFLRRAWPTLSGFLEDAFKNFKDAFMNIYKVILGIFSLFKALFEGRFLDAIKILLKDIMLNLLKAALQVVGGIINVLVGVVVSAIVGLAKTIASMFIGVLKRIPVIGGAIKKGIDPEAVSVKPVRAFASGGMTSSGYSLVGEQGPELLKLPVGSRIRSNRETMDMMGTTNHITVQVTGRVGASDQEIKDIARKVSREINIQMNRTGSTGVRF